MKKTTKYLLLFLALLLPVLVYVFLKAFGRNEFDVPALFQEAVTPPVNCESYQYPVPYVVPETVLTALDWSPAKVNVFVSAGAGSKIGLMLAREFEGLGFVVHQVPPDKSGIATCALLLQPPANAVVVDSAGKIRGQYDINDREELDRLIVELKILLMLY
jgi:hypothetical protein